MISELLHEYELNANQFDFALEHIMSINTLIRSLNPKSTLSFADAAANYKQDCSATAQYIKQILSFGLKDAWDKLFNLRSKRESVRSFGNMSNMGTSHNFSYEGKHYRLVDLRAKERDNKSDVYSNEKQSVRRNINEHQVVMYRIESNDDKTFIKLYSGSLADLAKRATIQDAN